MERKKTQKPPRSNLRFPRIAASYIEEPSLEFGGAREHLDPQTGIACFGPRTLDNPHRHPSVIRVAFVGSGRSTGTARTWIQSCLAGVNGDENNRRFVGTDSEYGFFSKLIMDDDLVECVTQHELSDVSSPRLRKDRFRAAADLISDKLRLLSERDRPPDYVVLALPGEMLEHCQTVDYSDPELGKVHRDFRRVVKADAMKYRLPTQILLQKVTEATPESKNVDHKSKCAWNLFTSMYFKAGGIPWSPKGLMPGTCYVGISFFRPLGSAQSGSVRASIAQAFDEYGEGLVLRGQDFTWDEGKKGKSPHLSEEQTADLMAMVLRRYRDEMKQTPARVVVHKSSRFWPDERKGLEAALGSVDKFDLVSVTPTSEVRLLREGQYPPLRGTWFSVGRDHFLYTTGFVPALGAYPHGHVPSPLQVTDHIGDTDIDTILHEILLLTKMNWNSAAFGGLFPITLKFSRLVGDIMREIPPDRDPLPQFKYYV